MFTVISSGAFVCVLYKRPAIIIISLHCTAFIAADPYLVPCAVNRGIALYMASARKGQIMLVTFVLAQT